MTLSERIHIIIMSSTAPTIAMTPTMIKPILLTKEFFEKPFISPDKAALYTDIEFTM